MESTRATAAVTANTNPITSHHDSNEHRESKTSRLAKKSLSVSARVEAKRERSQSKVPCIPPVSQEEKAPKLPLEQQTGRWVEKSNAALLGKLKLKFALGKKNLE